MSVCFHTQVGIVLAQISRSSSRRCCLRRWCWERGRWGQRSSSDCCRGGQSEGTACLNQPVQTKWTCWFLFAVVCVCVCVNLTSSPVFLCPAPQAHWSPLYSHLCSSLQVSASGTEWPGTSVSDEDAWEHTGLFMLCVILFFPNVRACFCLVCISVPSVLCPTCCSSGMKLSAPSAEDGDGVPLRTTNNKLKAHHRSPFVVLETELCSQQGRG